MIRITDKRKCSGCGACINACPKDIISFYEDGEGFLYPQVRTDQCIECHLCEKACPFVNPHPGQDNDSDNLYPRFFAAQLKEKQDLFFVSSGGAFWALARAVISQQGVVFGAAQRDVDTIFHMRASSVSEAEQLRRSKYFQSDTRLTFRQVKRDLLDGRKVLYSGTACQIAGLRTFLGKDYDALFTCDVVCHGVPSRKVWRNYRQEKEASVGKKIRQLVFRDKSMGWSHNQYKITYDDGTVETERSTRQLFHAGYLQGLFYRPSCGSCRFASIPRVADITLADYWQYQGKYRQNGCDLGVSLITVNNEKGQRLLKDASAYMDFEETKRTLALASCRHLDEHPFENPDRKNFFRTFEDKGYYAAAQKYIIRRNSNNIIRRVVCKLKRIITHLTQGSKE